MIKLTLQHKIDAALELVDTRMATIDDMTLLTERDKAKHRDWAQKEFFNTMRAIADKTFDFQPTNNK